MYDANTHYLLMARRSRRRVELTGPMPSGGNSNRAAERIIPGMKPRNEETRLDRILKPYRGRSYEGPTEPENV